MVPGEVRLTYLESKHHVGVAGDSHAERGVGAVAMVVGAPCSRPTAFVPSALEGLHQECVEGSHG